MSDQQVRKAVVARSGLRPSPTEVSKYLPVNYWVVGWTDDLVIIEGKDSAGWTLDDYVIPRLASGLISAKEYTQESKGAQAVIEGKARQAAEEAAQVAAEEAADRKRQVWVAANLERVELREQAWRNHKSNLEVEERRYQAELDHIDEVYDLRISAQ